MPQNQNRTFCLLRAHFLSCMWCKSWPAPLCVNLAEPVHVLWLVAAGMRLLFFLYRSCSSFLRPLPLGLPVLSSQDTLVYRRLMAANDYPVFWETFLLMKACGEMFTMWELFATFGEKQLNSVSSIRLLFLKATNWKSSAFAGYTSHGKFCSCFVYLMQWRVTVEFQEHINGLFDGAGLCTENTAIGLECTNQVLVTSTRPTGKAAFRSITAMAIINMILHFV